MVSKVRRGVLGRVEPPMATTALSSKLLRPPVQIFLCFHVCQLHLLPFFVLSQMGDWVVSLLAPGTYPCQDDK